MFGTFTKVQASRNRMSPAGRASWTRRFQQLRAAHATYSTKPSTYAEHVLVRNTRYVSPSTAARVLLRAGGNGTGRRSFPPRGAGRCVLGKGTGARVGSQRASRAVACSLCCYWHPRSEHARTDSPFPKSKHGEPGRVRWFVLLVSERAGKSHGFSANLMVRAGREGGWNKQQH
jgi:hypothetical protein